MSVLELNSKAKKYHPEPPPPKPNGFLLEEGKKYVTYDGVVVAPAFTKHGEGGLGKWYVLGMGWYDNDGHYTGDYPEDYHRCIKYEWFDSWEVYEAWLKGKAIEVALQKDPDIWHFVHQTADLIKKIYPGGPLVWWQSQIVKPKYLVRVKKEVV